MLYQDIGGRKLYSTGAMWFKLPKDPTPEMINIRQQQITMYSGGSPLIYEALTTLANEGRYRNYNPAIVETVETIVERMKDEGVVPLRHP